MASKTKKFNTKAIPDSPGQFHTFSNTSGFEVP
jgi:hypothetical protein